jgi:hypothetical protein
MEKASREVFSWRRFALAEPSKGNAIVLPLAFITSPFDSSVGGLVFYVPEGVMAKPSKGIAKPANG